AAPHSIAASWMGLSAVVLAWLVRALATRRTGIRRTPLDLPLWLFFAWTAASCFLSAEPRLSIPKLINVSTFLMFYLAQSFLTRRVAVSLACVLIVSASAGALWGAGELVVGRGVVVRALSADSLLRAETPPGARDPTRPSPSFYRSTRNSRSASRSPSGFDAKAHARTHALSRKRVNATARRSVKATARKSAKAMTCRRTSATARSRERAMA